MNNKIKISLEGADEIIEKLEQIKKLLGEINKVKINLNIEERLESNFKGTNKLIIDKDEICTKIIKKEEK